MPITIGLLRRWSTSNQDDSYRKEVQLDVLIEHCTRNGWTWKVYDEGQVSGQRLEKRKKALELLGDLKAGRIQGLGALDLTRVTRDRIGIDRATIKGILIESRAILVTRDKIYDLRRADDAMLYDVVGALSGHQVTTIRNTFWDGNIERRVSGPPSNCSRAPIGYKHEQDGPIRANGTVSRRMVKDDSEADVVRLFWELAATAPSYSFIRNELNHRGVPFPRQYHRKVDNRFWDLQHVRAMVNNWCYSGIQVVGRMAQSDVWDIHPSTKMDGERTEHGGLFERPVPEWQYVPEALQRAVVQRLNGNIQKSYKNFGVRGVASENPLRGVLYCGRCGAVMYRNTATRKLKSGGRTEVIRHVCSNKVRMTGACKGQAVMEHIAVRVVVEFIAGKLSDPDYFLISGRQAAGIAGTTAGDALSEERKTQSVLEDKLRKVLEREIIAESAEETAALKSIRLTTETEVRASKQRVSALEGLLAQEDMLIRMRDLGNNFAERILARPWYIQHQVITAYLSGVKIAGEGNGGARRQYVTAYRLAGSDEWVEVVIGRGSSGTSSANDLLPILGAVLRILDAA